MSDSERGGRQLELTERQATRLDRIKRECTEGGLLPEPSDEDAISSLLDTWDAVGDGLYSDEGGSK